MAKSLKLVMMMKLTSQGTKKLEARAKSKEEAGKAEIKVWMLMLLMGIHLILIDNLMISMGMVQEIIEI